VCYTKRICRLTFEEALSSPFRNSPSAWRRAIRAARIAGWIENSVVEEILSVRVVRKVGTETSGACHAKWKLNGDRMPLTGYASAGRYLRLPQCPAAEPRGKSFRIPGLSANPLSSVYKSCCHAQTRSASSSVRAFAS
jgi:hypothetical protein